MFKLTTENTIGLVIILSLAIIVIIWLLFGTGKDNKK